MTTKQILINIAQNLPSGATLHDAIRAAHTLVTLGNNQAVQHHFLLSQLSTLALSGKGQGKALEDADDDFMVTV